ncbi:uncharacterized protein [Amphiura filiformis]|uniref:uncharacterized protein n=1 Tax=Amphiura filiformis TaxID=82378 RepID=UPI003B22244C
MDTSQLLQLLNHMDLVHETKDNMYLWPGKLPNDAPEIVWEAQNTHVRGQSIECVADIDIFNPNVFPSVQKKILDENKYPRVSRSAVIFKSGFVEVLVQMTKTRRAINIAAMCPNKDNIEACNTNLEKAVDLIQSEITEKSPGTSFSVNFISQDSLKTSKNLDDVLTYTRNDLIQAERNNGLLDRYAKQEDVTNILFPGYDKMFLQELGSECRYEWLPIGIVRRCFERLDVINEEWKEDYRSVGKALGIAAHVVDRIADESITNKESPTNNIIKTWCTKNNRKMTIGMLQTLLSQLSLVANEDALIAVKEVIQTFEAKHSKSGYSDDVFTPGVSENITRWRMVLKRQWKVLKAHMDPRMLASRLQFLAPDMCTEIEESSDQRTQKVKRLLQLLLHCEDETWPNVFIDALRDETKHLHLAKVLKEEFQNVVRANKTEVDSPASGDTERNQGISETDLSDVARKAELGWDDLNHIFVELGLKGPDIENAVRKADTKDFQLQSINVLRFWRHTNGEGATREAIIEALEACKLIEAKEILLDKWANTCPGVSENILRWRVVLKRQRTKLEADMDPKMLAPRLTFIPSYVRTKIEESSDHQRMENVETLLECLLHCKEEAWPNALIDALQGETKHLQLTNALKEFENVASGIKTQADSPSGASGYTTERTEHSTKESPYPATSSSDDKDDDGAVRT